MRFFALDLTATDASEISGLSILSTNTIYQRICTRMAQARAITSPFQGELEADESYCGLKSIRGKQVRGAGGKRSCLVFSNATTLHI